MKSISIQERRKNQKYIKFFAYLVFVLCVPYLLVKKNKAKILGVLRVISFPILTFVIFVFGQIEHPYTPIIIRFFTSVAQSVLIFFVFNLAKNTYNEVMYEIKNILN